MTLRLLGALIAGALIAPASAAASSVSLVSGNVNYAGAANEQDNVKFVSDAAGVTITDAVALKAGQGCTQVDDKTARCTGAITGASATAEGHDDSADLSQFTGGNTGIRQFANAIGSPGNDVLDVDPTVAAPVTFDGGPGNDTIYGTAGADVLRGGDGNDSFLQSAGADTIDGGPGSDTFGITTPPMGPQDTHGLIVDLANPDATPPGYKRIYAVETIHGTDYDDVIRGTDANEVFYGGAGNDTLEGRGGIDTLEGDAGDDTLLARDGLIDSVYCDTTFPGPQPGDGANDSAQVDGPEYTHGCEHEDRPPGTTPGVKPNGTNQSANAKWTVTWAGGTVAKPVIPAKRRLTRRVGPKTAPGVITGRLVNDHGLPITGALVDVFMYTGRVSKAIALNAKTDADGRVTVSVGAGPSRTIHFDYRPALADDKLATGGGATVTVAAQLTLKLARSRIANGSAATFSGQMIGAHTTGATIDLQTPVGGKWFTFDSAMVRGGHFRSSYRFSRTTKLQRYRIRARLHPDKDIPYAEGQSALRTLTVVP